MKEIFENAHFDIQKRQKTDPFLINVFNEDTSRIFFEHQVILQAAFEAFGLVRNATYVEIDKDSFVRMLKESDCLVLPKQKEEVKAVAGSKGRAPPKQAAKKDAEAEAAKAEEEKKAEAEIVLFTEADAHRAIEQVGSFDPNLMNYYDFLEALTRIADVYPFTKV